MKPVLVPVIVTLLAGAAAAQPVTFQTTPLAAPYLTGGPDTIPVLASPPADGSAAQAQDHDLFTRTRSLAGNPRWALATSDADLRPAHLADDFSCAAGAKLGAQTTPKLVTLLAKMEADAEQVTSRAKAHFHIIRPQVGNTAPICVPREAKLNASPAYPSGHTTIGWASALVLAEMLPDRATPILTRGRVFGESRIVCGVHWASDVAAGRDNGAAIVAVLHTSAEFQHDLIAARAEIAHAPQPDAAGCMAESAAAAQGW